MTAPQCVICAGTEKLHQHHIAGKEILPQATVPVCPTRHADWHGRLRNAGLDLSPTRGHCPAPVAVILGLRVILEDAASLAANPARARATLRKLAEERLRDLAWRPDPTAARISRGTRPGACLARAPRTASEQAARRAALATGLNDATRSIRAALSQPELLAVNLPELLQIVGLDDAREENP